MRAGRGLGVSTPPPPTTTSASLLSRVFCIVCVLSLSVKCSQETLGAVGGGDRSATRTRVALIPGIVAENCAENCWQVTPKMVGK